MKNLTYKLYKAIKFITEPILGNDGKLSGKRMLGVSTAVIGMYVTVYGVKHAIEHIESIAMIVAVLFGASFTFWGLTSYGNFKFKEFDITSKKEQTEK
jgi:hypothetical protein